MTELPLLDLIERLRTDPVPDGTGLAERIAACAPKHADAIAELAAGIVPLGVEPGRYTELVGIGAYEHSGVQQITLAQLLVDRETGLVRIARLVALHCGTSLKRDVEAGMAGAVAQVFDWPGRAGGDVLTVLGYVGGDAHVPSTLDVPDIALTMRAGPRVEDHAAHIARVSTALAIVDGVQAFCAGCISLPIEADGVFHQLAKNKGKIA